MCHTSPMAMSHSFGVHVLCASWLHLHPIQAQETPFPDVGHRIVDAAQILPQERYPFLALFNFHPVPYAKCTGSLISQFWVISAAHCLGAKAKIQIGDCGTRLKTRVQLRCESLANGDLKITPIGKENIPEVLLGVNNIHREYRTARKYLVDFIIRPRDSYPGGNYGAYGGYDLILVKMREPVTHVRPICLPIGQSYPDEGPAVIAGYGRYKRPPCEVGSGGPHKFEFCGVGKECFKGSRAHTKANCSISFPYKGQTIDGCSHEATPTATNPKCGRFLAMNPELKFGPDVDEFVLLREQTVPNGNTRLEVETECFRENPGSFGWCGTIHNYTDLRSQEVRISPEDGWGFCQRSCFPEPQESLGGVERHKAVEVISNEYCHQRLTAGGTNFRVLPKVLCVAFNHTYKTRFYTVKTGEPTHPEGMTFVATENQGNRLGRLLGRSQDWYISGTGSCAGDSGGPLFKLIPGEAPQFVLIGITSRGTGIRGNCGGLDNPTHYVRVKLFVKWILSYVEDPNLCLAGSH